MAARGLGRGLGKGLDTLIPPSDNKSKELSTNDSDLMDGAIMVKLTKVEPNREQPRKRFEEESIQELSESIKQFGLLQPLLVQDRKGHYEIIAGERRWRAAKLAG